MQPTCTHPQAAVPTRAGGHELPHIHRNGDEALFESLDADANRYGLLLLVKRVGKAAGFTPRMIQLLDYYMAYTREIDWKCGSRPVVYQSLARTALDLGVTERQIQRLEQQLFEVGAVTWNDSGNHRRHGQRCLKTGKLIYAYGIDLTPLAYLAEELEAKLHAKQLYEQAWLATKREISSLRRQIRAVLIAGQGTNAQMEGYEAEYSQIAIEIRTYLKLPALRTTLSEHRELLQRVREAAKGSNQVAECDFDPSRYHAKNVVHKETTTHLKKELAAEDAAGPMALAEQACGPGFQASQLEPLKPSTEPQRHEGISRGQGAHQSGHQLSAELTTCISADSIPMTERFRSYLPVGQRHGKQMFVEAADRVRRDLRISTADWSEACHRVGRWQAAKWIAEIEHRTTFPTNPIHRPAGYFRRLMQVAQHYEVRGRGARIS